MEASNPIPEKDTPAADLPGPTPPVDPAPVETPVDPAPVESPAPVDPAPVESPAPVDPDPDETATTDELLRAVLAGQKRHRAEVASLREQINQQAASPPPSGPQAVTQPQTAEELTAARQDAIKGSDFYCPGCGTLYDYRQRCTGRPESPHPPIEVVSTDELKSDDTSKHTAPVYVTP